MKTSLYRTAGALLLGLFAGNCETWAQLGNPTARPPGGANSAGTAGVAGTARPAGSAGTTSPAGTAKPAGQAGTSRPATLLAPSNFDSSLNANGGSRLLNDPSVSPRGFDPSTGRTFFGNGTSTQQMIGGNPGMFNRGSATGAGASTAGRAPGSALPGRANFGLGSASATFLPSGPVLGVPYVSWNTPETLGAELFDLSATGNAPINWDAVNLGAALGTLIAPISPVEPLAPEGDVAPTAPDVPAVRPTPAPQVILNPNENDTAGRTGTEVTTITSRQQPIAQGGTATATAFPSRNSTATGEATATGSTTTTARPAAPDSSAVRSDLSASGQRSVPRYTLWQGYYWSHVPRTGWNYWDGLRWVQFDSAQSGR